jgi:MFS family permease
VRLVTLAQFEQASRSGRITFQDILVVDQAPTDIEGIVGGLITALALKWTHPFIPWKNVAIVALGWGLGWLLGGAIGEAIGESLYWEWYYDSQYYPVVYALSGAIGGAAGSWITFWQFRQARQSSP